MGKKIGSFSPKEAFDKACRYAKLILILQNSYQYKFDLEFYDLVCLCLLILYDSDEMLSKFLCTEILQTTFDNKCQKVCISRLQNMVQKEADKKAAFNNDGIHPKLIDKIESYDKLKNFIETSKSKYAEYEIDNVIFGEDIIDISITSTAEYVTENGMFATAYPLCTVNIKLSGIINIMADTYGWKNLKYGKFEILPCKTSSNEEIFKFSYIHELSNEPYFAIKCKRIYIEDISKIGINFDD